MSPQHKSNVELSCEPRLLAAALAGLLSLTACSTTDANPSNSGAAKSTGGAASSGGAASTTGGASSGGASSSGGATSSGGASTGGVASSGGGTSFAGGGGVAAVPEITSSKQVLGLDAAGFKALCDARGGTVEVMAHCGGLATARGFSYDTGNSMLSEHTCKGANTCAGWNCVTNK
jgi:hypothetical protein